MKGKQGERESDRDTKRGREKGREKGRAETVVVWWLLLLLLLLLLHSFRETAGSDFNKNHEEKIGRAHV